MGVWMSIYVSEESSSCVVSSGGIAREALNLPSMPPTAGWDDRGACWVPRVELEGFARSLEWAVVAALLARAGVVPPAHPTEIQEINPNIAEPSEICTAADSIRSYLQENLEGEFWVSVG